MSAKPPRLHNVLFTCLCISLMAIACEQHPKTNRYFVLTDLNVPIEQNGGFERERKIDTVLAENDSAALWKGVYLFLDKAFDIRKGNMHVRRPKLVRFNVVNERGNSIVNRVSLEARNRAEQMISDEMKK